MGTPHPLCFLDGDFVALAEARVSVLDRSFLFGDGVYEVVPVYDGNPFLADAHLQRLSNSLKAVRLECDVDFSALIGNLVDRNGGGDMAIYLQVSRGACGERNHDIPGSCEPTVFAMSQDFPGPAPEKLTNGISVVTCDDIRWLRCDIKATSLLANVLLKQMATDQNADEAVLVRDGQLTEGASSSVFVVSGDRIATPPNGHALLPGTTRSFVIDIARDLGLNVDQRPVAVDELSNAGEIWISSALREVLPVTRIDGNAIGNGRPGPLWQKVYREFQDRKRSSS